MIAALSLTLALIATLALAVATVRRRWFAERFASQVDTTERLAEGPASARSSGEMRAHQRTPDLDTELGRLSRALERLAVRAARDVAAVEAERRKLDEILAGVPEGLLVTTADRVPIYANPAFRELFDVDPGASTTDLLALVRWPQVHEVLGRVSMGSATHGEVGPAVEIALGGREVSVVARQLESPTGILLMARDVTEANRLTRMRREFVTNLSHEIKTPLAVIRGAAETLEEAGPADAEAAEHFVRRIIEQTYRLEDLLKDLLTLSRLESPEASQHRHPIDLAAIARRAVELLGPLAARAQVALRSEIEAVPVFSGDAKALERLVLNLVVNGIQYNRKDGHVTVRLRRRQDAIELEVEDDGAGIPAAEVPRIFERFYRVDKGRGRAEGGSGLGLAIVKHVVQAHGGSVEVKTAVDAGTLFRVLLPVGTPTPGRQTDLEGNGRLEAEERRARDATRALAG